MTSAIWSEQDVSIMRAALDEARCAAADGEVPVGAIVAVNDDIVARGRNRTIGENDPSGHAEIVALRAAGIALDNHRLSNATLYVTLEPCVMCAGAVGQARIARVVFAAYDKKAGALGSVLDISESRALNHSFEINGGLLADESSLLLRTFFQARR